MLSSLLVDGTDLAQWANRRDSQSTLPRLIRNLVLANIPKIERINFAAGEGVSLGGWDGITIVDEGDGFLPTGTAVWEMGVNKDIKGKADGDYQKRSKKPLLVNQSETTFIFVTPRRWGSKDNWIEEKNKEGIWKEVRVYDADDLETWLDLAPAVHIWLSVLLGKHPQSCKDLRGYWEDWSEETEPILSPELVLAGRENVSSEIYNWIETSDTTVLALRGETREEAIAVFAASISVLSLEQKDLFFSKSIVVYDENAWALLSASQSNLILIPAFDIKSFSSAKRNKHHILVPLGQAANSLPNTLQIQRLSRDKVMEILKGKGINARQANELGLLARRGFTTFRRRLAHSPEIKQPLWAQPSEARALIPIILVGTWNGINDDEKKFLEGLSQSSYDEITITLSRWANESDPPIRQIGNTWYVVSKEDAWSQLVRYLTPLDIERFKNLVLEALCTINPKYELPSEKRWMANVIGKPMNYSGLFIKDLSDTLAFMASKKDSYHPNLSLEDQVSTIIYELFERAKGNWRIWASLSTVLPLLAEAAPEVFLDALEYEIVNEAVIKKLFDDQENALFSSSPHTGLLWALETLAWSPEYISRATIALARICNLDPGGKLSNRPKNSLREIFLSWNPSTFATIEQRIQVLKMLQNKEPDVTWQLLCRLLPEFSGVGHGTAKPIWKEWSSENKRFISQTEHDKATHEIVKLILLQVGKSGVRWEKLIEALPHLPSEDFSIVMDYLSTLGEIAIASEERVQIWNTLRELLSKHRSYPDSDWALPKEEVDEVEVIYDKFEPHEPLFRYAWLFDNSPGFPDGREDSWEEQSRKLQFFQSNALMELYGELGIDGIESLIGEVESLFQLGSTLGEIGVLKCNEEDDLLEKYLNVQEQKDLEFGRGYIVGKIRTLGSNWAIEKLNSKRNNWTVNAVVEILINLPTEENTWELIEGYSREVEERYWSLISPYAITENGLDVAVEKYLLYELPYKAIDLLAIRIEIASGERIAKVLEKALSISPKDSISTNSFSYHVSELFQKLEESKEVTDDRIASLEWAYLPLLDRYGHAPRFLHRELSRNASFFAEVISLVYNAEGSESGEISEHERQRATQGYDLLESWRTLPGLEDGNSIDELLLMEWIENALKETAELDRGEVFSRYVGKILSTSIIGLDGAWPHEAVRGAIEEFSNIHLERGLEIGIYNSRGIVSKGRREGGQQEQQLTKKFNSYADITGVSWPRTTKVLRSIANTYAREARSENLSAELRTDLDLP